MSIRNQNRIQSGSGGSIELSISHFKTITNSSLPEGRYFKPLDSSDLAKRLLINNSSRAVEIVSLTLQAGNPLSTNLACRAF